MKKQSLDKLYEDFLAGITFLKKVESEYKEAENLLDSKRTQFNTASKDVFSKYRKIFEATGMKATNSIQDHTITGVISELANVGHRGLGVPREVEPPKPKKYALVLRDGVDPEIAEFDRDGDAPIQWIKQIALKATDIICVISTLDDKITIEPWKEKN